MASDFTMFWVEGQPMGKQRHRMGNGHTYTPAKTVEYEKLVKASALVKLEGMDSWDKEGMFDVVISAFFRIPKSWSKKKTEQAISGTLRPTTKPDCDNIAKIICDALNGVLWNDDSQVIRLMVAKHYVNDDPQVLVCVGPVTGGESDA